MNPLGMCSRKANQAGPGATVQYAHGRGLLTSHHLRHIGGSWSHDPRNQQDLGPEEWHLHDRGGKLLDPDRTTKVLRFHPALPATDHAAQQDMVLTLL